MPAPTPVRRSGPLAARHTPSSLRAFSTATLAALLAAAPVWAADEPQDVAAPASKDTEVFEPDYFAVYNPVTARDMVRQIPGFSIDNGDNVRGFGATAGNVLINGERPTTKDGVSNALGRIAASRVARIELLRSGSNSSDVRGRTTLVNVVLTDDDSASTTYWVQTGVHDEGGRMQLNGQLTRSFRFHGADVTLGAQLPGGQGRSDVEETRVDGDGVLLERRDRFHQNNYNELIVNGAATWSPTTRDTLSLNMRASRWRWHGNDFNGVTDPEGVPLRAEFFDGLETDTLFLETGADWERQLTERASFKLVGLNSYSEWTSAQTFDVIPADGGAATTLIDSPGSSGERVGRGTWTWRKTDNLTLEAGAEAAFNFRDTNLGITVDDGSGPVPLALPVAVTRVEELRGEAFTTVVWQMRPRLKLEGGFNYEASRISQSGDAEQERELRYPKPHLIASYDVDDRTQLRLSLTREVGQLNFGQFASSVSLTDDTVTAGNPNLEPQRAWRSRAEWQRQFGARGSLTLAGFYDAVEGVEDLVVLDGYTGPGNLGDGVRWGASVDASAPLDAFGLAGAQLKLNATARRSEVDDPLTGETRTFSGGSDWWFDLDFRQDLPMRRLAWGWSYGTRSQRPSYRADELDVYEPGAGNLFGFVETTRFGGVTLRFAVDNILNPDEGSQRYFYDGTRASGVITGLEDRHTRWGRYYAVRVSGKF